MSRVHIVTSDFSGGVLDYAGIIAATLGPEASVCRINRSRAEDLQRLEGTIFLQYSGYGYAKRGAPLWLLDALRHRPRSLGRVGIFFHELYALRPPWSSAFWLSPVQRYIARELALCADFWMTSCEKYAAWLRRIAVRKPYAVLPVFSNVGEFSGLERTRRPRLVVFGGPRVRRTTYVACEGALLGWAKVMGIDIHDIGPPMGDASLEAALKAAGAVCHGVLDVRSIGELLGESAYGAIAYPSEPLAKSSVLAAYCAYGLCPVVLSHRSQKEDGLSPGVHFLHGIGSQAATANSRTVAAAANQWYLGHGVAVHVNALRGLLRA